MLRHLCIFIFTLFLLFPVKTFAQEPKFAVSQEIIYQIDDTGQTTVIQNFTFTNLTSDFFPQEYRLSLPEKSLTNLSGTDRLGTLTITTTPLSQTTFVTVKFNDQVTGVGKILRWTLTYEDHQIAQKQGRLWVINIPPSPPITGLTTRAVRLIVPTSFGQQVLIKPSPAHTDLFWDQNSLGSSPILAYFDPQNSPEPYQVYNFRLTYQLTNTRLYPVTLEVALPPDTNYQKIFLSQLTPKPVNVNAKPDGNWLASFQLGPAARLTVLASGSALVSLSALPQYSPLVEAKLDTTATKYWQALDPQIKTVADQLPDIESVTNYVQSTLKYSSAPKTERVGARALLVSPKNASALDFADLFLTLARAKNIPARQVRGFYINRDITAHVWEEYYDATKNVWHPADLALQQELSLDFFQKFDVNHLAIWQDDGQGSPILPTKFEISPAATPLDVSLLPHVTAALTGASKITAGFEASATLFVENLGPTLFKSQPISISSETLELPNKVFLTTDIPPFGNFATKIKIGSPPFNQESNDIITLKFGLEKQDYPVKVVPLYKNSYLVVLGGLIFFGIISIIAQVARSLSLQKRRRENNLRRESQEPSRSSK